MSTKWRKPLRLTSLASPVNFVDVNGNAWADMRADLAPRPPAFGEYDEGGTPQACLGGTGLAIRTGLGGEGMVGSVDRYGGVLDERGGEGDSKALSICDREYVPSYHSGGLRTSQICPRPAYSHGMSSHASSSVPNEFRTSKVAHCETLCNSLRVSHFRREGEISVLGW